MPSFQSAGDAKNSLERLTQNLNQLQQQAQQMSNNQMMAQREGEKTLLVGKKRQADEIRI